MFPFLKSSRSVSSGFFSPSSRESMDPIAELLSQLSGVRRATASDLPSSAASNLSPHLHRQQVSPFSLLFLTDLFIIKLIQKNICLIQVHYFQYLVVCIPIIDGQLQNGLTRVLKFYRLKWIPTKNMCRLYTEEVQYSMFNDRELEVFEEEWVNPQNN